MRNTPGANSNMYFRVWKLTSYVDIYLSKTKTCNREGKINNERERERKP